jgi:hypothetical protein
MKAPVASRLATSTDRMKVDVILIVVLSLKNTRSGVVP